jgi:hypothetical protein
MKSNPDQIIALVGNKTDLDIPRTIERRMAEQYARDNSLLFFETSAKTGELGECFFPSIH